MEQLQRTAKQQNGTEGLIAAYSLERRRPDVPADHSRTPSPCWPTSSGLSACLSGPSCPSSAHIQAAVHRLWLEVSDGVSFHTLRPLA